jgi:hypothetical protein
MTKFSPIVHFHPLTSPTQPVNIFLQYYRLTRALAVSVNPSSDEKLHLFLQQLVGFDCVDDESKSEYISK